MPSQASMWEKLNWYLDDDQRLVSPEMYLNNRHLYDDILNVVYIIRDRQYPKARLEWVKEANLGNVMKNHDFDLLSKQLIVSLRLPWKRLPSEWLVSQKELDENREYFDILDTFLKVRRKDNPKEVPLFDVLEFEENRDKYEVVEVRYLVTMKLSKTGKARLLGIDPDSISTYMQI